MKQEVWYIVNYFVAGHPDEAKYLRYQFKVCARTWREAKRKADEEFVTRQHGLCRVAERLDKPSTVSMARRCLDDCGDTHMLPLAGVD